VLSWQFSWASFVFTYWNLSSICSLIELTKVNIRESISWWLKTAGSPATLYNPPKIKESIPPRLENPRLTWDSQGPLPDYSVQFLCLFTGLLFLLLQLFVLLFKGCLLGNPCEQLFRGFLVSSSQYFLLWVLLLWTLWVGTRAPLSVTRGPLRRVPFS
jgi:hypothetical protein